MSDSSLTADSSPIYSDMADDEDFLDLIEMFVEAIPERVESMTAAYEKQDWATLKDLSHQLKGAGGGYGFGILSTVAAELETACKQGNAGQIQETFQVVIHDLQRVSL